MNHDGTGFLAAIQANGTFRFVYTKSVDNIALGNFLQIHRDGTTVVSSADGRVLRVVRSAGEIFEYSYNENTKQLSAISFPNGSTWSVKSDGKWKAHKENDPAIKHLHFIPSVDQEGNLWLRDIHGVSRKYVCRANGR